MTASARNDAKTVSDREDYVEDQEIKRKQEEQLNQQNTGWPEKDGLDERYRVDRDTDG